MRIKYTQAFYNACHEIADQGLVFAINNYRLQKESFLKQIKQNAIQDEKEFISQINQEILQNTVDEEFQNKFNKAFNEIEGEIYQILEAILEDNGKGINSIHQLVNEWENKTNSNRKKKEDSEKKFYKRMISDIEKFLTTNNFTRESIKTIIEKNQLQPSKSNMETVNQQFYGYARKVIFSDLLGKKAPRGHYIQSLKGYYREEFVAAAINKVLCNINYMATTAGAISNRQKKETPIDILIGPTGEIKKINISDNALFEISDLLEALNHKNIDSIYSTVFDPTNFIGLQSKSWIEPWVDKEGNHNFLSLGKRNTFLNNRSHSLRSWHEGIALANSAMNIMDLIGAKNTLFSTGNQIYWTEELLSNFRERKYYLAFYISKKTHVATGDLVFEQEQSPSSCNI